MEFLGLAVEGVGGEGRKKNRPDQLDQDHFKATVAKILAHEEVTGIAWTQYTPYFNDGEPCVFRASDPSFAFSSVEVAEKDIYFDYGWMETDFEDNGRLWCGQYNNSEVMDKVVGKDDKNWGAWGQGGYRDREWTWKEDSGPENAPNADLFNDIHEFIRLLDGGHYDHTVEDLFGDHAVIMIDKLAGKVIVDEYEHD